MKRCALTPELEAALDYAQRGWPVLFLHSIADGRCGCGKPECGNPGKHPIGRLTPHGLHDATTNPDVILGWALKVASFNVAIRCGPESGVVALDVDVNESLAALQREHGPLPETRTHRTGRGFHYLFVHPGNGTVIRPVTKLGGYDGLDFKADDAYIVAPPSVHVSGERYEVEVDDAPLAPLPEWLLRLAQGRTDGHRVRAPESEPSANSVCVGARNTTLTRVAGTLRRAGLSQDAIEAALLVVNHERYDPPLDDAEVRRIAASVARYEPEGKRDPVRLHQAKDLVASPVQFQVEGLLPSGMLTLLSGKDGLGKTLLALEMIYSTLTGVPLLKTFRALRGPAVALLLDDPPSLIVERLSMLGIRNDPDLWIATSDDVDLTDPLGMLRALEAEAIQRQAKLIVLDALYLFLPLSRDSGNDAARMRPLLGALNDLAHRTGATVVLIAHDNKSGADVAGSYVIRAGAKVILRLLLPQGEEEDLDEGPVTPERVLRLDKTKFSRRTAWRLRLDGPGQWRFHGTQAQYRLKVTAERVEGLLKEGKRMTSEEIAKAAKRRRGDVDAVLTSFERGGRVRRELEATKGRPKVVYLFPQAPDGKSETTPPEGGLSVPGPPNEGAFRPEPPDAKNIAKYGKKRATTREKPLPEHSDGKSEGKKAENQDVTEKADFPSHRPAPIEKDAGTKVPPQVEGARSLPGGDP